MSTPNQQSPLPNQKLKPVNQELKLDTDCFGCKVVGSGGAFAIGSYLLYTARVGQFRGGNAYKYFLTGFGYTCWYVAAARWLYLPPFHNVGKKIG